MNNPLDFALPDREFFSMHHLRGPDRAPSALPGFRLVLRFLFRLARTIGWLSAGLVVLLSGGCRPPENAPLRLGVSAWPGYEILFLAEEKGFFRQAGVEVRLLEFGTVADSLRAFESGKIDGLATTLIEVLMARDRKIRDPRVARVFDFSNGADVIIGGRGIRSIPDLRGKRVGTEVPSFGLYMLARALEMEGLKLSDVAPVSLDLESMPRELESGRVEAIVSFPPFSVKTLQNPDNQVLFSSRRIPGEVADVLAVDGPILRQRSREVNALLRALDRAQEYVQAHPGESFQFMAQREGITAAEFQRIVNEDIQMVGPAEMAAYTRSGGRLEGTIATILRVLREIGTHTGRPDVADCLAFP